MNSPEPHRPSDATPEPTPPPPPSPDAGVVGTGPTGAAGPAGAVGAMDPRMLAGVARCVQAARAVWLTAAAMIVLFGGCSLVLAILGLTPAERWPQVEMDVPAEQMRVAMWVAAGVMTATMWLPGLALLFLGFGVKAGRPGPTLAAAVILIAQAVLLGLFLLLSVGNAVVSGQTTVGLALPVVVYGGVMALVVWAAVRVLRARQVAEARVQPDEEPWNSHLTGGGW